VINIFYCIFFLADSQVAERDDKEASQGTIQVKNSDQKAESSNTNQLAFFRKNLILKLMTTCALLGIILLSVFLFNGNQKKIEQGDDNENQISDGDDSRKNTAINSTIGNLIFIIKRKLYSFLYFKGVT
jgi:hypothetical protein